MSAIASADQLIEPDEQSERAAYWLLDEPGGSYWAVTLDKMTGAFTAKRWATSPDGDGDTCLVALTGFRALGLALMRNLTWDAR